MAVESGSELGENPEHVQANPQRGRRRISNSGPVLTDLWKTELEYQSPSSPRNKCHLEPHLSVATLRHNQIKTDLYRFMTSDPNVARLRTLRREAV